MGSAQLNLLYIRQTNKYSQWSCDRKRYCAALSLKKLFSWITRTKVFSKNSVFVTITVIYTKLTLFQNSDRVPLMQQGSLQPFEKQVQQGSGFCGRAEIHLSVININAKLKKNSEVHRLARIAKQIVCRTHRLNIVLNAGHLKSQQNKYLIIIRQNIRQI